MIDFESELQEAVARAIYECAPARYLNCGNGVIVAESPEGTIPWEKSGSVHQRLVRQQAAAAIRAQHKFVTDYAIAIVARLPTPPKDTEGVSGR